jgi:hypothetical protein
MKTIINALNDIAKKELSGKPLKCEICATRKPMPRWNHKGKIICQKCYMEALDIGIGIMIDPEGNEVPQEKVAKNRCSEEIE